MNNNQSYTGLEIAIIGIGCRFPGAQNWKQFWHNLTNDVESVQFLSEQEMTQLGVARERFSDPDFVRARILLDDKDQFDPFFFDYRPGEATLMHPIHRIFHECAWEALEDSGYYPEMIGGSIGLFAGAGEDLNWRLYSAIRNQEGIMDNFSLRHIGSKDFLTSLLAYKLGINGPGFSVNTACSTSLVAVNLACKSLLFGESKIALAGGVSIVTQPQSGYLYKEGMIHSADGHCRAFDERSSGTIGGEGAGVVVLKKLSEAIRDGDHIYSVIKGSAINNDGGRKVGYTAPSVSGQVECIRRAQRLAKVDSKNISYVEAHGTGTKLGDAVEVEALNQAFGNLRDKHCALGSVKTNIGHLDTASGVAGLIKVALSLKHRQIPASLNFNAPNGELNFENGPFFVNNALRDWTRTSDRPLLAAVSSLGIGGTNAHVILEEFQREDATACNGRHHVLTLSAKTESSLQGYIRKLSDFLDAGEVDLANLSYTFQARRKPFAVRTSIVFSDHADLLAKLSPEADLAIGRVSQEAGRIVFMFSGAGSQYINMGRELYGQIAFFRDLMDAGFAQLEKLTGENYKEIFYPESADDDRINQMVHTQPVIFLFGYSLARLMIHWGVTPDYLIGHSIGEYVAACISGVFEFEEGLQLVVRRGQLMDSMPPGAMVSAAISPADAEKYLDETISLAAVNGPAQIVFSGPEGAIDQLIERLDNDGIETVKLRASQAGHSHMMDFISDQYLIDLQRLEMKEPKIPIVSNLTGEFVTAQEIRSSKYWLAHMRRAVRFAEGISCLLKTGHRMLCLEVGAGRSLTSMLKQQSGDDRVTAMNLVRHPYDVCDDDRQIKECLGKMWAGGTVISWDRVRDGVAGRNIPLPTYHFDHQKFPTEVTLSSEQLGLGAIVADSAGVIPHLGDWLYHPVWKKSIAGPVSCQEPARVFLVFTDGSKFFQKLAEGLIDGGRNKVIRVVAGSAFARIDHEAYCMNPINQDEYASLANDIVKQKVTVTDIIYGWASLNVENGASAPHSQFYSLSNICKALLQGKVLDNSRLVVLTDRLHKVLGNEEIRYHQSLLLGLISCLPQEYSLTCKNVDISLAEQSEHLIPCLIRELSFNGSPEEQIVSLRYGQRWIPDYQLQRREVIRDGSGLKRGGRYLLTGGLGNMGSLLAAYLLREYNCQLLIVGRSELTNSSSAARRFDELLAISPYVVYVQVDVSDYHMLKGVVDEYELAGRINGVIHIAGNTDVNNYELAEDITQQKAGRVFAPKVVGIENIATIFQDGNLDFVWAASSLSALLGGISFSAYASASAYLNHFVTARHGGTVKWRSVGFSEMFFEQESIDNENPKNRKALVPSEIIELFEWSLHGNESPVVFETIQSLPARIAKSRERRSGYLDNSIFENKKTKRPNLSSEYVSAETEVEKQLIEMIEDFFGIESLGVCDDFFELGGDSLKAMALVRKIKTMHQINLTLKEFFMARNIRKIAAVIEERKWASTPSQKKMVSII